MKKYLLLPFLFVGILSNAQMLHLKNASFIPTKNITELHDFSNWTNYEFENNIYCIIQFDHSTAENERIIVEKSTGIHFDDYMPRWAFLATVPKNFNVSSLSLYGVRSIIPFESSNKVAKLLVERPLPNWIQKSNGRIEVVVDIFSSISKTKVQEIFAQKNIQIVSWENENSAIISINENEINTVANFPFIKYVQPTSAPAVYENLTERTNHRVNYVDAAEAYTTGLHYDGTGVEVSMGDDGTIGPHIDYKGRVFDHTTSNTGTHADHVAGILAGGGNFDPITSGNGRGSDIHVYNDYSNITNAATDYTTLGVRILSNSLGQTCNLGYNNNAKTLDQLLRQRPFLLSVHSTGNSGTTTCGGVGQGFFTVTGGYKAGKNTIAVGNVDNSDVIAPSSSRGPSEDGRLKPEIVATGTNVYSTQPDNTYDTYTGTSMACPAVSGTLACLMQAYRFTHAGADPYNALLKVLLMNTADDLGNKGPDFIYGYGRINARRAYDVMNASQYTIDSVANGVTKDVTINVPVNTMQLKVMLYWNDYQGNPASTIMLVNDLDLTVEDTNPVIFKPWVLNNAPNVVALNSPAVPFRDSLNNVEQVTIDLPQAGAYTIHVNGHDIPFGTQKYVITYEIIKEDPVMTYPNGGEGFANGVTERIRWDAYGNNLGVFKLEYSENAGATWSTISNSIPGSVRYYDWTPPNTLNTGKMLMKISRAGLFDNSDTLFTVLGVPADLTVDTACGNTFHLKWSALANAEGYNIYMLGAKYMQEIGTSTTPDFYVTTGVNLIDTFYFAVSATKISNGAKGLRCIAYQKLPGDVNCVDNLFNYETSVPNNYIYGCSAITQVPITIKLVNNGLRTVSNIPVYYQANALAIVSETINQTLNVGDSVTYTFNTIANLPAGTVYTIRTWTYLFPDSDHTNDTSSTIVNIVAPLVLTAPTVEDFEGSIFPPNGWRVMDNDSNVKWQKTLCLQGANGINTHAAYMDFFNYNNLGQIDDLETPEFDLTTVTSDSVIVTFDVAYAYNTNEDTLEVVLSNDCTFSYNPTGYKKWGANLATAGMMNTIFSPTSKTQWRNDRIDLSSFIGQKIFLRFRGTNLHGNNVYIDNVNLIKKNVTPLSISNQNEIGFVSIFPNPSDGNYTLEINATKNSLLEYSIINIAGQKVKQSQFAISTGTTKMAINITDLPNGIYTLELKDGIKAQNIKLSKY